MDKSIKNIDKKVNSRRDKSTVVKNDKICQKKTKYCKNEKKVK